MFTDLFAAMRERRGLAQFAGVSMVFRRYTGAIRFKAPVRIVMIVVAAVARTLGLGDVSSRTSSPRSARAAH